jgi:hypothetical protein
MARTRMTHSNGARRRSRGRWEGPSPVPMRSDGASESLAGTWQVWCAGSVSPRAPQSNLIWLVEQPLAYPVRRLRRAGGAGVWPDHSITGMCAVDETASLSS